MDLTYVSLFAFFMITLIYFYYFKLPFDDTVGTYANYLTSNMSRLALYFFVVLVQQFAFNLGATVQRCGGSVGKNLVSTLIITIIPWVFIFGSVIMALIVYPGLKGAFADVVGYFFIYNDANNILGKIIVDTDLENTITKSLAEAGETATGEKSTGLRKAAEAIMKLCGNKGILVNSMNPENFNNIWGVLTPLITPDVGEADRESYKKQLKELVIKKDNIGEGLWYIYTGLLLTSIVSYNLISRGCSKDLKQIADARAKYLKTTAKTEAQTAAKTAGKAYTL